MKQPRLPTGFSDPISYTCTCPASTSPTGGLVLLFYRYFASPPSLSPSESKDTSELAAFHTHLTQTLHLAGKIRVAEEGFNITLGGTYDDIQEYMDKCISHWSFAGLDLATEDKKNNFFKPSPGCACCFGGDAGVRITTEITPMGVTNYLPRNWESVTYLSPEEFHQKCHGEPGDEEVLLVDVRNHYESRIGHFVSPRTGEAALRPAIRRFSQWPLYVRKRFTLDANLISASPTTQEPEKERAVLTYCTGGIRCEKGARFLSDSLPQSQYPHTRIYTLHGGIAAYLTWLDAEILAGRKNPSDSLFKGRNYVFDARGSTGLTPPPPNSEPKASAFDPVSQCHICSTPSGHLSKCSSTGCHLILVVCEECELHATEEGQPAISCCESCALMDRRGATPVANERENTGVGVVSLEKPKHRPICECERERERLLWGVENTGMKCQSQKMQQEKKKKNNNTRRSSKGVNSPFGGMGGGMEMNIRVKTFN